MDKKSQNKKLLELLEEPDDSIEPIDMSTALAICFYALKSYKGGPEAYRQIVNDLERMDRIREVMRKHEKEDQM